MNRTTRVIDPAALVLARRALKASVRQAPLPPVPDFPGSHDIASVFVTIRHDGALRGCLGDTSFDLPFGALVIAMTGAAATKDPRFPPVTEGEIDGVTLEISRLTRPEPVTIDRLQVGRHGIIVSHADRRGLLLPQVAVEFGCDARGFVELGCHKAGLAAGMAENPGLAIECFEVEVSSE